MLDIGTVRADPGERRSGRLIVGHYPDGPVDAPIIVVRGRRDGPVLWIQACVHGGETGGAAGALRFVNTLDPAVLRGSVIAVLAANPTASRSRARVSQVDGGNLNRLFPGLADGLHSQQTAAALFDTFLAKADLLVDLHSGGETHVVPLYALNWEDASEASAASAALVDALGIRDIWRTSEAWLSGSMFAAANRAGKPGLLIECGGGGPVAPAEVDAFARALQQAALHLGMIADPNPDLPPQAPVGPLRIHRDCTFVNTHRGGLFVPAVEAGQVVPAGTRLGHLLGLDGDVVETFDAPVGPAFIAALPRSYCPLHSGVLVAECVTAAPPPAQEERP